MQPAHWSMALRNELHTSQSLGVMPCFTPISYASSLKDLGKRLEAEVGSATYTASVVTHCRHDMVDVETQALQMVELRRSIGRLGSERAARE